MEDLKPNTIRIQSADDIEHVMLELSHLKQHLASRDEHVMSMENELSKSGVRITELEEQLTTWREKYERLYDSHKRVQKLNQILEDKLLGMVDKAKADKAQLTKDIATLSVRLAESKHAYIQVNKENKRYKNDMNLAIQLLQCKPDNFVSQKLDNLSSEMQARVSQYILTKRKSTSGSSPNSVRSGKNGNELDNATNPSEFEFNISPALMTKILEDSMQDTITKHCDTCSCKKSKQKPFNYGEPFYTVATQTVLHGDMKNSLCLNCNGDVTSNKSNLSQRSNSPLIANVINKSSKIENSPVYIVRHPPIISENLMLRPEKNIKRNDILNDKIKSEDQLKLVNAKHKEIVSKLGEDITKLKKNFQMEPVAHHRLCSKMSPGSSKDLQGSPFNECLPEVHHVNMKNEQRKDSRASSMSRTSSVAKSTSSTQRSNTHVGPGPRFCSVRMQEGSNNILLDNAQPDVPPIIYRRQSGTELFDSELPHVPVRTETNVAESTLVDVNVETPSEIKNDINTLVNLMKVSSSPLQPLKSHNYTSSIQSSESKQSPATINPLDTTNPDIDNKASTMLEEKAVENEIDSPEKTNGHCIDNCIVKSDAHILDSENVKQKEFVELMNIPNNLPATVLPANMSNMNDNHTQQADKAKLSVSSLSSEDSNLVLQKQQLKRVAEWVQQNLEQNHNYDLTKVRGEDSVFVNNNQETSNLQIPIPHNLVKMVNHCQSLLMNSGSNAQIMPTDKTGEIKIVSKIVKETVFPAECSDPISHDSVRSEYGSSDVINNGSDGKESKELSPEELARMEYNVKKFLLSGHSWIKDDEVTTQAQTYSKTETDI